MFSLKKLFRDPKIIISPESLKRAIEVHEFGVILDVRTQEEYLEDHLADSISLPLHELSFKIASLVPVKTTRIFCYCDNGNRSYEATKLLRTLGYQLAYSIDGGIVAWRRKGFPVVQ